MNKIIINADDFGLTEGVNEGVIESIKDGLVNSTSVMVNMPASHKAIKFLKKNSQINAGLHLTLTKGKPLSDCDKIKSLVDHRDRFYSRNEFIVRLLTGKIFLSEIETEIENQIQKLLIENVTINHIDSHHHIHIFPRIYNLVCKVAKKHKIKYVRSRRDVFLFNFPPNIKAILTRAYLKEFAYFLKSNLFRLLGIKSYEKPLYLNISSLENFKALLDMYSELKFNRPGLIICHPGMVDEELKKISGYTVPRETELKILTDQQHRCISNSQTPRLELFLSSLSR